MVSPFFGLHGFWIKMLLWEYMRQRKPEKMSNCEMLVVIYDKQRDCFEFEKRIKTVDLGLMI